MCGIWASLNLQAGRMAARRMHHRGPDDEGYEHFTIPGGELELAHRRLAIIDPDPRSKQPMSYAGGRYWLTYNGEIYNYLELREELVERDYRFTTASDSEVLIAAWDAWGPDALERLVGMFAFALFDRQRDELVVARDPFGIKPLYYTRTAQSFAFCSEIAPLLEARTGERQVEPQRLFRYLRFGITDDGTGTLFCGVEQIPAAHYARIDLTQPGHWSALRYWKPTIGTGGGHGPVASEQVRDAFLDSVRLHLRSDVRLGAALSGGIDSSAIVGAMRRLLGDGESVDCFSFVAPGAPMDERHFAEQAASSAGARCHQVTVSPGELVADLDRLITVQEEPFGSTSIYAQYRVMRLAAETGVKVMLDGQGADELFAGYRPYLAARFAALLRQGRPLGAVCFLRSLARLPDATTARWAAQGLGLLAPPLLRHLGRGLLGEAVVPAWMKAGWFEAHEVALEAPTRPVGASILKERLMESLQSNVLPALLRYEDRNSMCHSIESRVPFLTTALADLAYSLDDNALISTNGVSKAVFRDAMRGLVPDAILDRRDKIGFATPEQEWLIALRPWFEAHAGEGLALLADVIDVDGALSVCREALDGRRRFDFQVWRFLNIARWSELFEVSYG